VIRIFAGALSPAAGFHSHTLAVAVVAGAATFGTVAATLSASGMFLGWVAYSINSQTIRQGYANLASFLLGLVLGIGTTLIIDVLAPALGLAATGIIIFCLVALVMTMRLVAPINNPLAYFLGITSFFYSGLSPTIGSFALLAAAGAIGATGAALSACCQAALLRKHPTPA
jgi:hypothetical protein